MTENRFDYTAYDDGTESIYDREKDEYYFDMQLSNIEELLNELNGENEELKKILKFLRNDNATDILNVLNSQENQIWELKKENEQLRKENKELHFIIQQNNFAKEEGFE